MSLISSAFSAATSLTILGASNFGKGTFVPGVAFVNKLLGSYHLPGCLTASL